jgi:transposase InsO family protein
MFISTTLDDTQKRYTVTEKELYAIVYSLKKYKPYIYARKFSIATDHRALIWLCGKKDPCSRLGRWSQLISDYAEDITFVAGKNNKVADALSRSPFITESEAPSMDYIHSNLDLSPAIKEKIAKAVGLDLNKIKQNEQQAWQEAHLELASKVNQEFKNSLKWAREGQNSLFSEENSNKEVNISAILQNHSEELDPADDRDSDDEETELVIGSESYAAALHYGQAELETRTLFPILTPELWGRNTPVNSSPEYIEQNSVTKVLRYKNSHPSTPGLLWVPPFYRRDVLRSYHYLPTSAHPSLDKMCQQMKLSLNWLGMRNDVDDWIKSCEHCQLYKHDRGDKPEFLERRKPQYPMQRISMDFLSLFSSTLAGDYRILVIVDERTRYAEAYIVPNEQAKTAADVLVEKVICRYGLPDDIVSDQGSAFISDLFENMCYQLALDKIFTCAYHPEGNGVNERMHSTLYTILRSLSGNTVHEWKKKLPYALYVC